MEILSSNKLSCKRKIMDVNSDSNINVCHESSKFYCSDSTRKQNHSEIEKRRRDKMNRYILELSSLIPICKAMSRKVDKLTVLRMAVQQMKTLRSSISPYISGLYKPSFLSDEELKSLLFQSVRGFLLVVSCDRGRILFVSESVCDILNYTPSEILGQSWFDMLHPKDIANVKEQLLSETLPDQKFIDLKMMQCVNNKTLQNHPCLHPGLRRSFYCRMKCKEYKLNDSVYKKRKLQSYDQRYCMIRCVGYLKTWMSSHFNLIEKDVDSSYNLNCLVVIGQPSQTENKLRFNCNLLPQEFTCRLSVDGKFLCVDQQVTVLGYLAQELVGLSFYEFLHQSDVATICEIYQQAILSKDFVVTPIYRFRTKDGSFVHLQSKWKAFHNPWTKEFEFTICVSTLIQSTGSEDNEGICNFNKLRPSTFNVNSVQQMCSINTVNIDRQVANSVHDSLKLKPCSNGDYDDVIPVPENHSDCPMITNAANDERPGISKCNDSTNLWQFSDDIGGQQILIESYQKTNTEDNDEAAMASIMSLLEADAGLGGPVDFNGLPWPLP